MNKYMLMLVAAGALVVAPAIVKAEETAVKTEVTTEVAPAAVEHELEDGTKVSVEGDMVSVVAADGTKTPAPDGEHKAKDGTTLTVKEGKLVK